MNQPISHLVETRHLAYIHHHLNNDLAEKSTKSNYRLFSGSVRVYYNPAWNKKYIA